MSDSLVKRRAGGDFYDHTRPTSRSSLGTLTAVAVLANTCFAIFLFGCSTEAYLPSHIPPWPPTYNVTKSLITMQCNSSGYSNVDRATEFGIVSYDWSNAKAEWAKNSPMDCQERLSEQARMLYRARTTNTTDTHIFLYRNIVKALPWFSTVRAKLIDPAYRGFFLGFGDAAAHVPKCAAENESLCSDLYHDQEQTPQVPTSENPRPDGVCEASGCDCGEGLPCGEYYFDHRNGTMLREWLVNEVVLGALIGDHDNNNIVDGLFLDDYWCSDLLCDQSNNTLNGCPCDDPNQGPTEANEFAVPDIGLSDKDVLDMTLEWNQTMALVEKRLLEHGAYTWWLMEGQENANAMPYLFQLDDNDVEGENTKDGGKKNTSDHQSTVSSRGSDRCLQILVDACRKDSSWQNQPRLFGFSVNKTTHRLSRNFGLEWAFFLLVRGPYAWAGWGDWGMTWPFQKEPAHGALPPLPRGVPLPYELTPEGQIDYGVPLGVCRRDKSSTSLFRREWSNGWVVEIDCNTSSSISHGDSYSQVGYRITRGVIFPESAEV